MSSSLDRASSRRKFLTHSAMVACGLPILMQGIPVWAEDLAHADTAGYVPPVSPRALYNFNIGWKFQREDVTGAEATDFKDEAWTLVSTPHTYNDVDSYRQIISHGGGDRGSYKGQAWYRKHFTVPVELKGNCFFLEFEGMRQAGEIYLNGKQIGLYENGVTAYGLDLTDHLLFGKPNVLAIKIDNRSSYVEQSSGTGYEWNSQDFNPNFGGINRSVWLHVTGTVHQTLPLYYGLETSGVYIWGENYKIADKTTDVNIEVEVKNSSSDRATAELSVTIVDHKGRVAAQLDGSSVDMVKGEKTLLTAQGRLKNARFWSVEDPYLYQVYSILSVDGNVVDVEKTTTGFRKSEFKGGAGSGGVFLNEKFVYLKGFAQRSSNSWAGLGQCYPGWMHDLDARLIRNCHGNHVRWMHVAPQRVDADACARYGIVQVCPAGDKEGDKQGRQWEQRAEVMRATMIYFRNNPSILFWEAGNSVISVDHMKEMLALAAQWDAHGGRVVGARGNDNVEANAALNNLAGYFPVMLGQDARIYKLASDSSMFRAYSGERRDRAPLIEAEDFREECARRYWDVYSPPYFGFKKGPNDTYEFNNDTFALAGIKRYFEYWANRISNKDRLYAHWSGYASIYFNDCNADGRQDSSEVARVSGKVDAVRLPKDLYYAHRVMQNDSADVHILGHWSYPTGPDAKRIVKSIYVIANTGAVELFVNGKSLGVKSKPEDGYVYEYPNVEFVPGTLRAVAKLNGRDVIDHLLSTAGPAAAIKLTPMTGPSGWIADGADIALIDVEVVDANGRRCPTDDARIDFTCAGPAIWRGGYNSGKTDSTNELHLNTELGINRVAVRSTLEAGTITVTAKRNGLTLATLHLNTKATSEKDGLSTYFPVRITGPAES
ncbi:glycoside hydrolase family 2 protein [Telmatobacter bradus]|uniref:glycoside hydrolase family 2 protein n=1 Tax=Telmatobacter bradus TaxID=474953 RepID=UPI003B43428F